MSPVAVARITETLPQDDDGVMTVRGGPGYSRLAMQGLQHAGAFVVQFAHRPTSNRSRRGSRRPRRVGPDDALRIGRRAARVHGQGARGQHRSAVGYARTGYERKMYEELKEYLCRGVFVPRRLAAAALPTRPARCTPTSTATGSRIWRSAPPASFSAPASCMCYYGTASGLGTTDQAFFQDTQGIGFELAEAATTLLPR